MKESILISLDTISDVVCESEIAAAEALLAEYDKALAILEYSETEPEQFGIFQEGKIMDDVKKQGEGQSKVMRILSFIPRLIAALFKAITGKLQTAAKSAKNVIENTKGKDQSKMKTFIEGLKKGDKKAVKTALIGLGAVAAGAVGAGVVIKKKSVPKTLIGAIKEGLPKENGKAFDEFYKSLHEIMTDKEIEEFIDFLGRIDYDKLSKKYPKEVLDEIREYKKKLEKSLADRKNSEKELNATESSEKKESESSKNEPKDSDELEAKINKAIDDIMKQYSDLEPRGNHFPLIEFEFEPRKGLKVAYNRSAYDMCFALCLLGDDIIINPNALDKFKSFFNSYSDTIRNLENNRYRALIAVMDACHDNKLDEDGGVFPMWYTLGVSNKLLDKNDSDDNIKKIFADRKHDYLSGKFGDVDPEAASALEIMADLIRRVNRDTLAYTDAVVDIVTKLEDIFGSENMRSHIDKQKWESTRGDKS